MIKRNDLLDIIIEMNDTTLEFYGEAIGFGVEMTPDYLSLTMSRQVLWDDDEEFDENVEQNKANVRKYVIEKLRERGEELLQIVKMMELRDGQES